MKLFRTLASLAVLCLLVLLVASGIAVAQTDPDQAGPGIERRPIEDPLFGVRSVVPADWQALGGGTYARGTPPDDLALIAIQSAPATPDQLWQALLPQLGISEVPESTGQYASELFEWTLFRLTVPVGGIVVEVELALAEHGERTDLVLVQSAPDEFEVIREQVFLPALAAFAPLAPEPTPDPSTLGYIVEEVTFPGGSADVELAGTLTLPSTPGPHPVVVLMSGSGAQDRDESLRPVSTLKPFALIADALTSAGVAVLRYDDRGVGGSSGDYDAATVQQLAADGSAAIDYLATRAEVDQRRIGILGHSEGGYYAAMIAPDDPRVAFVVLMAPPAVNGVDMLVAQNEAMLRSAGESDDEIEVAVAMAREVMPLIRDGQRDAAIEAMRAYFEAFWERQDDESRLLLGDRDAWVQRQTDSQLATMDSDWFRSLLAFDPQPGLRRITVPVLGLFGGKDVQVVTDQSLPALEEALRVAGNDDFETVVLPDANHLFQASRSGAVAEYSELPPVFTTDFLPTLVAWVTAHVDTTS